MGARKRSDLHFLDTNSGNTTDSDERHFDEVVGLVTILWVGRGVDDISKGDIEETN